MEERFALERAKFVNVWQVTVRVRFLSSHIFKMSQKLTYPKPLDSRGGVWPKTSCANIKKPYLFPLKKIDFMSLAV